MPRIRSRNRRHGPIDCAGHKRGQRSGDLFGCASRADEGGVVAPGPAEQPPAKKVTQTNYDALAAELAEVKRQQQADRFTWPYGRAGWSAADKAMWANLSDADLAGMVRAIAAARPKILVRGNFMMSRVVLGD